jgi:Domain of Unknown Function (DUF1080)
LRAIEVQVLDHGYGQGPSHTTHGDVFPIHGSSMKPFGRHNGQRSFPSEERSKGSPEWNHYRITCQDGTLRLEVNGKAVSGGSDCHWRKGYLALESEGGVVDWRHLRIKELPGGKATAEQSAPLADGRVSLYDGRSLTGWTATPSGEASAWRPKDWELLSTGKEGDMVLDQKLHDFTLQFDVRTDTKDATAPLPVCLNGIPATGRASNKWTRYHLTRTGSKVECRAEGSAGDPASVMELAAGPAVISLKSAAGVRLAGIYLKQ